MTIRTAIIGASFARDAYLPALANIDDAEVVAIASARLSSARATADQFGIPQAYDDWREMLGRHEVDLVCIATPPDLHAPMTLAALEAGAHVLCEKPMAMDAGESRAMLEAAEAAGKLHVMGHELRFNPNRGRIKALLDTGEIGEVRHLNMVSINAGWGDPASRPAGDWWSLAEHGGGRFGAAGSHAIDLIRWWLGDVGALSGQVATMVPDRIDARQRRGLAGDRRRPVQLPAGDAKWRARVGVHERRRAPQRRQQPANLRQRGQHPPRRRRRTPVSSPAPAATSRTSASTTPTPTCRTSTAASGTFPSSR